MSNLQEAHQVQTALPPTREDAQRHEAVQPQLHQVTVDDAEEAARATGQNYVPQETRSAEEVLIPPTAPAACINTLYSYFERAFGVGD